MSDEVVCEPPDIQYRNHLFKVLYLFLNLCSHKTPPLCHVTILGTHKTPPPCHVTTLGTHKTPHCHVATLGTHKTPPCHVTTWKPTRHHQSVMSLPGTPQDTTSLSCHYPGTPQDITSLSCHYPGNPQDITSLSWLQSEKLWQVWRKRRSSLLCNEP